VCHFFSTNGFSLTLFNPSMDLVDRFKQNLKTTEPVMEVSPSADSMTTTSTTWTTFLESMENAKQKAAEIFSAPPTDPIAVQVSKANIPETPTSPSPEGPVAAAVKSWWTDATAFFEETRITVEEKIAEMTGPVEMKNDPLKNLRLLLVSYTNALEQLKADAFNLSMGAEIMSRIGSHNLARSLTEPFGESGTVTEQFGVYRDKYTNLVVPALEEVRGGVEMVSNMVTDEIGKIQALQTRFKRRDRLHQSLSDMHSRVRIKQEKHNRRLGDGLAVDSQQLEELYELTRTADSIDSDFRITSEQLVAKCEEVLGNRSRNYQKILAKIVEIQNTFFYRISSTCSIPFQELHEAMLADVPPSDTLEDIGSLTWRSQVSEPLEKNPKEEYMPMKTSPSRRNTMAFDSGPTSPPARYSYTRPKGNSPIRRAGTSALLEDTAFSPK
jgi:hypothetical protein